MSEKPYKISERAPREMCAKELVTEYKQVKELIRQDTWTGSFTLRLEERLTMLSAQLAELYVDDFESRGA